MFDARPIDIRIKENETKVCRDDNCHANRYRTYGYCCNHRTRRDRYGDPRLKMIRKDKYKQERKQVDRLLKRNKDNATVLKAVEITRNLLELLQRDPGEVAHRIETIDTRKHARRLLYNADLKDVLAQACAMRLYLDRWGLGIHVPNPRIQADLYTIAVGNAALRACVVSPMRPPTAKTAKRIGSLLQEHLAKFFVNVQFSLLERYKELERLDELLSKPLDNQINL